MFHRPSWWKLVKYVATAFLAAWTSIYTWAAGQGDPKPWYVLALLSFKISAPIIAALLILVIEIYQEIREQSSGRKLKKYLDHLHRKYFPHPDGGLAPSFRITLFTPGIVRRWSLGVKARSGGFHQTSRVRWSIRKSEAEQFHGIAGYAWASGIFVEIDGLPDYNGCSPVDKMRYLKQTFINEEEIAKLHWKARSYRSLVVQDQRGEKIGVLMMESKDANGLAHITASTLSDEAENFQFLLL